jgi:hypothetical protein
MVGGLCRHTGLVGVLWNWRPVFQCVPGKVSSTLTEKHAPAPAMLSTPPPLPLAGSLLT